LLEIKLVKDVGQAQGSVGEAKKAPPPRHPSPMGARFEIRQGKGGNPAESLD